MPPFPPLLHRRYLYCPAGSQFEGRFAEDHLNNWTHAAAYPAFVLAGVVDFLALVLPFPPGTSQVRAARAAPCSGTPSGSRAPFTERSLLFNV